MDKQKNNNPYWISRNGRFIIYILIFSIIMYHLRDIPSKFIDHAFPIRNTSESVVIKKRNHTVIQSIATYPDAYKETYDLFDKHFNILLTVIMIFGFAIPVGAYLLQRQSLKNEREEMRRDNKKSLKKLKKLQENINTSEERINEQVDKIALAGGVAFMNIAIGLFRKKELPEIAWCCCFYALEYYVLSEKIYKAWFVDAYKVLVSEGLEIPKKLLSDKELTNEMIEILKKILQKEHIIEQDIKVQLQKWLNELQECVSKM